MVTLQGMGSESPEKALQFLEKALNIARDISHHALQAAISDAIITQYQGTYTELIQVNKQECRWNHNKKNPINSYKCMKTVMI